jgi:hypothetical protein
MASAARDTAEGRSALRDSAAGDDQARPVASPDKDNQSDGGPESDEEGEAHEDEVETSSADVKWAEKHNTTSAPSNSDGTADAPPLPSEDVPPLPAEDIPPLPSEAPPSATEEDDGWAPIWEESAQAFYFYNRFTGATQWTNPRVPEASVSVPIAGPPGVPVPAEPTPPPATVAGYNPAIHGDYDPNAWYAQPAAAEAPLDPSADPTAAYAATAAFNRFTGRFQASEITPELHNDENKSKRQMNAFFDVDAAANSHDGRSLKEERAMKKLSKQELKQFKEKRRAKKEEKRRAWLRD